MVTSAKMRRIVEQIAETDKKFIPVIESSKLCDLGKNNSNASHFESLVSSVISQQLATAAARTINQRFQSVTGKVTPRNVVNLSQSELRGVGLSAAKAKTIQGLASAANSKEIDFNKLHLEEDDLIYSKLTSLWGIGPWTVDMFMMFQLGKLNVWPTGDLGVRRGWEKIHRLKEEIDPKVLEQRGTKFQPHRSVVAWYCWRALDS